MPTFRTTLLQNGNNVGIEIPEDILLGFGAGKRVPVTVTLNGYTYGSTVAVMGGRYLVGVSAEHRAAAGVAGGEQYDVTVVHDSAPRTVTVPDDLAAALADGGVSDQFDQLAYSYRKEHVRGVEDAKTPATRERRIAKVVAGLG
jgi:hypothetical protein